MRLVGIAALAAGVMGAAGVLAQVVPQPAPVGGTVPQTITGTKAHAANAGPTDGKALFQEKCSMCHGPGGMGTGLLARRMDPKVAELEKRTDLAPDFVAAAARQGIGNMPRITRGEVSDTQLAAIAGYLSRGGAR